MAKNKYSENKKKRLFGRYITLPKKLHSSNAYRQCSSVERDLFMFVCSQYNGSNNGDLTCTFKGATEYKGWNLRISKSTFNRALRTLVDRDLLIKTVQGGKHKASRFAVATHAIDDIDGMELEKVSKQPITRFLRHET